MSGARGVEAVKPMRIQNRGVLPPAVSSTPPRERAQVNEFRNNVLLLRHAAAAAAFKPKEAASRYILNGKFPCAH